MPKAKATVEIVRGYQTLPAPPRGNILAIGNFDGVHVGHQRIFELVVRKARAASGTACVLTFDPHPAKVLAPEWAPPLIVPPARKLELIAACGIDLACVQPFDARLAALEPATFTADVLVRALGVRDIVVGSDFTYGRARAGTIETLREAGTSHGFSVTVVEKVTVAGLVASSSKVRELVLEGRVDGAARLLGRPFELSGPVVRGAGRGRSLGIPTANVATRNELLPKNGVYAGWVRHDGTNLPSAINIGTNPTFTESAQISCEAHVLDFEGDLYDRDVTIEFATRLRDEQRFDSPAALVTQIGRDIAEARDLLNRKKGADGSQRA
jgi:riboflavin kinase/FMN adenylyltransferase